MSFESDLRNAWGVRGLAEKEAPAALLDAWAEEQRAGTNAESVPSRLGAYTGWFVLLVLSAAPRFGRAEAADHYLAQSLRDCAEPLALWIELHMEEIDR